ncbi:hypothetical protein [Polynucleobacter sp. KF022]|uniref:bestrophin-like domain n=1 Tax=Polynucleobacter sp. KF022 TaxID=2982615 RepID=UPI0023776A0B|nr:hypothetical protein [Polynucleobacter sp. KF022]BDT74979.1 hypothetical protein PKF022_06440 [Polynucleobacter sp. KF022]
MSRYRTKDTETSEDLGIIQTATLTLLALIIGFTFSMAIDRHDQREIFEEGEANAIGTEFLRADLLPSKVSAATKDLLLQYVDQRILFYSKQSPEKIQEIRNKTEQLQADLWNEILPVVRKQDTPTIALVASGMNDVINSQGYVQAAWWNRIPLTAWALMAAIAVCANLLVGFGARNFEKNMGLFMIFPFVVSVSLFLIADIDSPRSGVIRIEARNLVALKNNLIQQMEKAKPSSGDK